MLDASIPLVRYSNILSASDLDVRLVRLDVDARHVARCATLLSPDEQERAKRFHFERDRRRYTVSRAALRSLLAERTGLSPGTIALAQTWHGKPYLAGPSTGLHFNLSHSGERAIYAISTSSIPGVDIERLNRNVDHDGIAQCFFAPRESADLQRIPVAECKYAFLALWTCKEAIAKAIGQGLQLPLNEIEVSDAAGAQPRVVSVSCGRAADWTLYRVDAGRDYVATVAAYRGPQEFLNPARARR